MFNVNLSALLETQVNTHANGDRTSSPQPKGTGSSPQRLFLSTQIRVRVLVCHEKVFIYYKEYKEPHLGIGTVFGNSDLLWTENIWPDTEQDTTPRLSPDVQS